MNTGATGPTGPTGPTGLIGLTPPISPTGIATMFPSTTKSIVEAPLITTIEELLASHSAIASKEIDDKATCSDLLNPSRESLRAPLFQWAALGFPALYVVKTFAITPPSICSDGVTRSAHAYVEYLTGTTHETFMNKLNSLVAGMVFSYSYADTLRLHVNKK